MAVPSPVPYWGDWTHHLVLKFTLHYVEGLFCLACAFLMLDSALNPLDSACGPAEHATGVCGNIIYVCPIISLC